MTGVSAIAFTLWPTALAVVMLGLIALWRSGPIALTKERLRFALVAGLLGHALPMSAVFWLSARAGAGFASLAFTLPPVFTLLVALLVRVERFSALRALAVLLGLIGALVLVGGTGRLQGVSEASVSLVELALVIAIPASIGAANVYRARRTPPGLSGEWMAALILGSSLLFLLLVGTVSKAISVPLNAAAMSWLVLQAAALIAGYIFYFELQKRAEPVTFSFMGYVMTITGVVLGAIAFGEALAWFIAPAVAMIVAALWLIQRARAQAAGSEAKAEASTQPAG